MTIAKSKKFRDQHGKILLEGRRLITDALGAGARLETLFFSNMDSLKELPLEKLKDVKFIKVKFDEIKMWSDLVTPQGALGCVDVWEPKVLRAGMGAHFRIPVVSNLEWEVVPNYLSTSTCVHVADHSCPVAENPSVLPESLSPRDQRCTSPHAVRKPIESEESDSEDEERAFLLSLPKVDIQGCYQSWAREQTAIVIGGETHGLSLEALLLVEKTRGKRLYIPMTPGVDSLNSAMAACILLFEGRRQLLFEAATANRTEMS
ncbi:rRNA methyltransferase 3A, mitochondrial isoform X2 [Pristis pectinata]|uniref:rRNA methyltransferase 3A, mitochondrial isoform X2 n=1 Tax=Pristis pectinata TaxID=685728 RepID=UPI00223E7D1E|nr:rRNA methyltransferase 3A, mitochondrial isoform X2 [Pristis pectinata]